MLTPYNYQGLNINVYKTMVYRLFLEG